MWVGLGSCTTPVPLPLPLPIVGAKLLHYANWPEKNGYYCKVELLYLEADVYPGIGFLFLCAIFSARDDVCVGCVA
ncbi:uncharacterized protein G2W53_037233 [Senna tora]|uniref:Uncharacterized protein n=1 Tax=Senna tora TaxID=362788 RepID=A0A834SUG2_9FABA|nr:uncharacterized protein G2W53_037233 [Senna tora]